MVVIGRVKLMVVVVLVEMVLVVVKTVVVLLLLLSHVADIISFVGQRSKFLLSPFHITTQQATTTYTGTTTKK